MNRHLQAQAKILKTIARAQERHIGRELKRRVDEACRTLASIQALEDNGPIWRWCKRREQKIHKEVCAYEYAISLEEVGSEKTNETIKDLRPMAETDSPELSKDEKDSSKHLGQDRSGERP